MRTKKIISFSVILSLVTVLIFVACSKEKSFETDKNAQNKPPVFEHYGWSFVNGNTNVKDSGCVFSASLRSSALGKNFAISGFDANGNSLSIIYSPASGKIETGTYRASDNVTIIFTIGSNMYSSVGTDATIIIYTINDTLIEAAFSGRLKNILTNELFSIHNGKVKAIFGKANPCNAIMVNPAVYTLEDNGTNYCITVQGNYNKGTALKSTNTMSFDVNVTIPGIWNITIIDSTSGIQFSGAGKFNNVGKETIDLTGSGIPPTEGEITYLLKINETTCSTKVVIGPPVVVCNPAANIVTITDGTSLNFPGVTGAADGTGIMYQFVGQTPSNIITLTFAGGAKPIAGVYNIGDGLGQGSVAVVFVTGTVTSSPTAYSGTSGQLTITTGAGGKLTMQFCEANFSKVLLGASTHAEVKTSGKISER